MAPGDGTDGVTALIADPTTITTETQWEHRAWEVSACERDLARPHASWRDLHRSSPAMKNQGAALDRGCCSEPALGPEGVLPRHVPLRLRQRVLLSC